jgi:hypothetical protein
VLRRRRGRYFIVNIKRDLLVNDHCDPEAVAREIGVMAEYERLVEDASHLLV